MKQNKFPPRWDEERVRRVLDHYELQTEEQALAEDEAAYELVRCLISFIVHSGNLTCSILEE